MTDGYFWSASDTIPVCYYIVHYAFHIVINLVVLGVQDVAIACIDLNPVTTKKIAFIDWIPTLHSEGTQ